MKKIFIYIKAGIIILFIISCSNKKEIKFKNDVSEYNYLDKNHELLYIYDFDSIFNKKNLLIDTIKKIEVDFKVSIIVISKNKIGRNNNISEDAKILNSILKGKFNLENLIIFEISKKKRKIAISTSENIRDIINDSISELILKEMKIKLKVGKYNEAMFLGLNKIKQKLKE